MTSPVGATTTEEGRYYEWHRWPGRHFPSVTTNIKKGVPKETMQKWAVKKVANQALDRLDVVNELMEVASGKSI